MPAAPLPDPLLGVFETLLVVDGRPLELDAHVDRLGESLHVLYASAPPIDARRLIVDRAGPLRLARLRLTVAPVEGERLGTRLSTLELDPSVLFPEPDRGAALRSLVLDRGLGAHKWADRRLLEQAEAAAGDSLPLLVDRRGDVLEASRANVFAVRDDALHTPPTDGRIIAGIARARVLELAIEAGYAVREQPLSLEDLRHADEVFLTGSVRGVEPVGAIDGLARGSGNVTAELASALRGHWLGQRQALNLP
jgi:para-aminobenzoate synthetase / 4-amino-4-deoxychorismate lyase